MRESLKYKFHNYEFVLDKSIDNDIVRCIDTVLSSLGTNVRNVLKFYLSKRGIEFEDIPDRPEEFSSFLREIYGEAAIIIEKMIVVRLAREFEIEPESEGLADVIHEIKTRLG